MSCEVAEQLWRAVIRERDKAIATGEVDDFIRAVHMWADHVEAHGCWRCGAQ